MSPAPIWIKICGITSLEDAEVAVQAGADAIGLNFVPASSRCVDFELARRIAGHVRGRVEVIGVVADLPAPEARQLRRDLGLTLLQLHGDETPEDLQALLPDAFKAIRIGTALDVERARSFGGARLLVDAKVPGMLGGTGVRPDSGLCRQLARARRVILAGGLDPANVADAIREIAPWGVDVASGVEAPGKPGRKDADGVRAFVERARSAGG